MVAGRDGLARGAGGRGISDRGDRRVLVGSGRGGPSGQAGQALVEERFGIKPMHDRIEKLLLELSSR